MIITFITGLSFIAVMGWLAAIRRKAAGIITLVLDGVDSPIANAVVKVATPTFFLVLAIVGAVFGVWLCIVALT